MREFKDRILEMNQMYRLPINVGQLNIMPDVADRLRKFKKVLSDELNEIDDLIEIAEELNEIDDLIEIEIAEGAGFRPDDLLTGIADLLGDLTVFCRSEALKYGIPLEEVLDIIMDSNASKLGADGQPIIDENGKFLKGPNYWKPEPEIEKLLSRLPWLC